MAPQQNQSQSPDICEADIGGPPASEYEHNRRDAPAWLRPPPDHMPSPGGCASAFLPAIFPDERTTLRRPRHRCLTTNSRGEQRAPARERVCLQSLRSHLPAHKPEAIPREDATSKPLLVNSLPKRPAAHNAAPQNGGTFPRTDVAGLPMAKFPAVITSVAGSASTFPA